MTGATNIGEDAAIFEAVHGSAPDIAGENLANPIALLSSAMMMLDYLEEKKIKNKIRSALYTVLQDQKELCTPDIGGEGTTSTFTQTICSELTR